MQSPASLAFIILNGPSQDASATSSAGLETVTIASRSHTVLEARLCHVSWLSQYMLLECPVVLITPEQHFEEINAYLHNNNYFGLNRAWFFHEQWPMVPTISEDRQPILGDDGSFFRVLAGEFDAFCSFLASDSCAALIQAEVRTLQVAPVRNLGATYFSSFLELIQGQGVDLVAEYVHYDDSAKQTLLVQVDGRPQLLHRAQISDTKLLDSLSNVATGTYWFNLHRLLTLMNFSVKDYLKQSREIRYVHILTSSMTHIKPLWEKVTIRHDGDVSDLQTPAMALQLANMISDLTASPKVHSRYVEVPAVRYNLSGPAKQLQLDMLDSQTLFEGEKAESDPDLKRLCSLHIEKMVSFFADRGASYLEYAARRWRALLEPDPWAQTQTLAMKLYRRAVATGQVCSGYIASSIEPGPFILLSVAPSLGIDHLLRSFPNGDYVEFIRHEWQQIWSMPDWDQHAFVHWMFLWSEQTIFAHLYYLWSAEELLLMIGKQAEETGQYHNLKFSGPPNIVPEELVPPHLGFKPFHELHREWMQHAGVTKIIYDE